MTATITFTGQLTVRTCPNCAGTFAIDQGYVNEAYRVGEFKLMWACPYCKQTRGYGESEVERKQKEIARLQTDMERKEAALRSAYNLETTLRKSRSACRGHYHRVTRRIKAGVCPCCTRTFQNLARHMHTKHPDMATEAPE